MDHGQGHGTTFKQVLSEKLGIDADLIRYRYGDSDLVTMGIGTFGSRSAHLAGAAIVIAADRLIDKGCKIAAHMMEAAVPDIAFEKGKFAISAPRRVGGPGRFGKQLFPAPKLPGGVETGLPRGGNFRPRRSGDISCRCASLRGRDRRGDRRGRADPLRRGRRCRPRVEPVVVRGADPRWDRAGRRSSADGGCGL